MNAEKLGHEKFAAMAASKGLKDVTEAEFAAHKQWSTTTAMTRIRNSRRGTSGGNSGPVEKALLIGYPLGGRDFVYRGITVDNAKSQFITVLTDDGFKEISQWGAAKFGHGHLAEFELDVSESTLADGRVVENRNIRTATVKDAPLPMERLKKIAKTVGNLDESDVKTIVAVRGVIGPKWDTEPIFEDAEVVGQQPVCYNKQPCLNFLLFDEAEQGGNVVRARLQPRKHSVPFITVEDFTEMAATENIEEYRSSFTGRIVYVVGFVMKANDARTKRFFQLAVSAIIDTGEIQMERPGHMDTTQSSMDDVKPTPQVDTQAVIAEMKATIRRGLTALGTAATVDSLIAAGFAPKNLDKAIVQMVLDKVKSEANAPATTPAPPTKTPTKTPTPTPAPTPTMTPTKTPTQKIDPSGVSQDTLDRMDIAYEFIKREDAGPKGVFVPRVLDGLCMVKKFKKDDAEATIKALLDAGKAYEPLMGYIKTV